MLKKIWSNIVEFMLEVRTELRKVSYPTYSETIGSTTVVIILVMMISVFLALADLALVKIVGRII